MFIYNIFKISGGIHFPSGTHVSYLRSLVADASHPTVLRRCPREMKKWGNPQPLFGYPQMPNKPDANAKDLFLLVK